MSMHSPRTYADILDRESSLESPEAEALLTALPPRTRALLIDHYLHSLLPNSQELLDFFVDASPIFKLIHGAPGSALAFEYLYTRDVSTAVDRYLIECRAGAQIYQRLLSLRAHLPSWLDQLLTSEKTIRVDNIGCGTGRDTIGVLAACRGLAKHVRVRHIDPDRHALLISRKLARENGVAESISFHEGKFSDVPPAAADMILLIGILCPLHRRVSRNVLRSAVPYVRPGGLVVYSTALHQMVFDDPLTDFLMRLAGWHMSYKSVQESEGLATALGWRVVGRFFDEPRHHHCMVVAEVPASRGQEVGK
jgi:SAM-dependent methyltransferase